jgi:hypothetical protein
VPALEHPGGHEVQLAEAQEAAESLGVSVKPYRVASLAELLPALAAMVSDGMEGLANSQGGPSLANRKLIVDFAALKKLPAVYQATLFADRRTDVVGSGPPGTVPNRGELRRPDSQGRQAGRSADPPSGPILPDD